MTPEETTITNRMKMFMMFRGTVYGKDNLPKDPKVFDIYRVFEEGNDEGMNYMWDGERWFPLYDPFTNTKIIDIPKEMKYKGQDLKRMPSPEEVDIIASHMIRNAMLEHKDDKDTLHIKCDAIIRVVLESLGMGKTMKEYDEASKKFRFS